MWWSRILLKKVDKVKVNIKTYHVFYDILRNFYFKDYGTSGLYIKQNLKIIILY